VLLEQGALRTKVHRRLLS